MKATDVSAPGKIRTGEPNLSKAMCFGSVFLGLPASRQSVHGDAEEYLEHP